MDERQRSNDTVTDTRSLPPTLKERGAVQRIVDRLLNELAPERTLKRADRPPVPVEAYRTPSGCILQGATEALSVSWFAEASDQATLGELQVVLWSGVVTRRGSVRPSTNAVVVKEVVLRPVNRPIDESVWQAADGTLYDGDALAALCIAMLDRQRDEQVKSD
jgi:hypothetical protein